MANLSARQGHLHNESAFRPGDVAMISAEPYQHIAVGKPAVIDVNSGKGKGPGPDQVMLPA